MEYLDIADEKGNPIGKTVSRKDAHEFGILHRTAHVWVIRETPGRVEVLLQKRSKDKDSFPDMYDTSSAGHIPAGDEPLLSAVRELKEELGIDINPNEVIEFNSGCDGKDCYRMYYIKKDINLNDITIQEEELTEVKYFSMKELEEMVERNELNEDQVAFFKKCRNFIENK